MSARSVRRAAIREAHRRIADMARAGTPLTNHERWVLLALAEHVGADGRTPPMTNAELAAAARRVGLREALRGGPS
ncbi:hypothetical protein [Agromyces binzhouensis]|uniref:hypothetical protein n=1 Tax=Agromyces binzhouensis TaxID=1817495 RepID=UPI0036389F0F